MTTTLASIDAPAGAQTLGDRLAASLGPGAAADRLWSARRRLESGESAVERIDLADAELTLGELLEIAWSRPTPTPMPARMGDWGGIRGRGRPGLGGAAALCAGLGAAHPLVLESTYTDTVSGDAGDVIYQPSTIAAPSGRRRLTLYARTATQPRPADPDRPWFAPFTLAEAECGYTPLCSMHRFRGKRAGRDVTYVADRLLRDPQRLRILLNAAIAATRSNAFSIGPAYLSGSLVDATGAPRTGSLTRNGNTYAIGGQSIGHAELVDRLLLPLEAVASGVAEQAHLAEDPGTVVPVLSGPLRTLLLAETAHSASPHPDAMDEQLLWRIGGQRGRTTGNSLSSQFRHLFTYAVRHAHVQPTLLVTAPTAPFDLLPDKSNRLDYALVRELSRTLARTPDDKVEQVVGEWYARRSVSLSEDYRARLRADPRTKAGAEPGSGADVALFPEILATTCRRACRVVAALNREARA